MRFSRFTAAAIAALFALPAAAATMVSQPGAPDQGPFPGQTLVVSFDAPNAPGFVWASEPTTRLTSLAGTAAAPAGTSGRFGFISSAALQPASALLSTPALRSISFYWGSVDGFNRVSLLGQAGQVLGQFDGNDLPMPNGSWTLAEANRRVGFVAAPGEWIHGIRFDTTGVAFEFDSIAAGAVPEPDSWAMLIVGTGLVGALQRRRQRVVAA